MDEKFIVIGWPEIQEWMTEEGFEENSYLINDDKGIEKYGSSAYFVSTLFIDKVYAKNEKYVKYVTDLINEKFVYVSKEDIDDFMRICEEMSVPPNGGALKTENDEIVGQYFYLD